MMLCPWSISPSHRSEVFFGNGNLTLAEFCPSRYHRGKNNRNLRPPDLHGWWWFCHGKSRHAKSSEEFKFGNGGQECFQFTGSLRGISVISTSYCYYLILYPEICFPYFLICFPYCSCFRWFGNENFPKWKVRCSMPMTWGFEFLHVKVPREKNNIYFKIVINFMMTNTCVFFIPRYLWRLSSQNSKIRINRPGWCEAMSI